MDAMLRVLVLMNVLLFAADVCCCPVHIVQVVVVIVGGLVVPVVVAHYLDLCLFLFVVTGHLAQGHHM